VAFLWEPGEGDWGFVVRSDTGEFVAAAAGKLKNMRDVPQAERVAASEGAAALGPNRVVFSPIHRLRFQLLRRRTTTIYTQLVCC
jgi:hypothetical protein